jgi:hypothetical protein
MDSVLVESYFNWLRSEAFSAPSERREYEGVLRELHDIPFYWVIVSDDNRAGDAMTFRQYEFLEFYDGRDDMDQQLLGMWATAAPSVLEVLLGIARRWAFYFGGTVELFFAPLFHNMTFDRYPGRVLSSGSKEAIRDLCDTWMSRQFQANGIGSPFPLNPGLRRTPDMRRMDIWSQMNAYSAEHFQ